jgi:serine/threonine-protein kinase
MATVFLAEEAGGRLAALKILHVKKAADARAVAGFRREAELMIKFDSPAIVRGYASGTSPQGLHWLALEYMDGETIQEAIDRDGRLQEGAALDVILAAARGVEYLSRQRLIHRDIKPANLMNNSRGEVKLLDLGFALPMGAEGARLEKEGHTSGTVHYMAPEQAQGRTSELDVRTDIYSLGATLYHMVVGKVPFSGKDSLEVMTKQVRAALSSTELKGGAISQHMHYFIERMMSKDKDFRYAGAAEMIADIQEQREGFESMQFDPEPKPPPARKPPAPPRRSVTDRFRKR